MLIGSVDITLTKNKSLIDSIKMGSKNLVLQSNIYGISGDMFDITQFLTTGSITYSNQPVLGSGIGFTIASPDLIKAGTEFVLSFHYTKQSGTLVKFGGYLDPQWECTEFYIDDMLQPVLFNQGLSVPNDTVRHKVVVKLVRTNVAVGVNSTYGAINIQPNIGTTNVATVKFEGIMMVEGNREAPWNPALEDLMDIINDQGDTLSAISEYASPERITEVVTLSEEFISALNRKADVEDISNMATNEDIEGILDVSKAYADSVSLGVTDKVNVLTSRLEKTEAKINANFTLAKGINLLRNSTGYFGTDHYMVTGTLLNTGDLELEKLGIGHAFYSQTGSSVTAKQVLDVKPDTTYSLSTWLKKPSGAGTAFVCIYDEKDIKKYEVGLGSATSQEYQLRRVFFKTGASQTRVTVSIECAANAEAYFAGNMLSEGDIAFNHWSSHHEEIANTNIQMNINGIKVMGTGGSYTSISTEEFAGYAPVLDETTNKTTIERIFALNGNITDVNTLRAKKGIWMGELAIIPFNTTHKGWAFVKNG